MKNLKSLLPVAALLVGLASCTPEETPDPTPTTPTTPTAPAPPSINVGNSYGGLVAVKMDFTYSQMGYDVSLPTETGVGAFYNALYTSSGTNTMVDAGTVKLNNIALDKNTNLSYTKIATTGMTPSDLDIDGGVMWDVTGGNGIPAFTYTHTGAFPDFNGTVPTTITRADGVAFTFNATTTPDADSVYVMIVSGSGNVLKAYAANAGPITIPGSELTGLQASSSTNPAYIEVIPWKYVVANVGSPVKAIAFVKEYVIVKQLTLN